MTYCVPILPRSGLANRLFTWARCKAFAHQTGASMIAPSWFQVKIGPLLRGESDWRTYRGLFQPGPDEISGVRKAWLMATRAKATEAAAGAPGTSCPDGSIVEFAGTEGYFTPLLTHAPLLRRELTAIVRPRWRQAAQAGALEPIGLHIRRGDFFVANSAADFRMRGAVRTPNSWFIAALALARRAMGADTPAFIVSDGRPEELADLLAIPGVRLVRTGSAISDLLLLSRAKVLLGSGGSTFSAWATFLGAMPTVSITGQSFTWYGLPATWGGFVGELEEGGAPDAFVESLARLGSAHTNRTEVVL